MHVRDREMTLHDACTSGTSRVLTVASMQQLLMEALILAPADCEVLSVIKFLNMQSIVPIEMHYQLCQVYWPNVMSKQMEYHWCRQFTAGWQHVYDEEHSGRLSILRKTLWSLCGNTLWTSCPVISIFSYTSRNFCPVIVSIFRMIERRRWVSHSGSNPRWQTYTTQG